MVFSSGCVTDGGNKTTKHYVKDGISFDYPENWQIANATAPDAVVAVVNPGTVNPETGMATTVVVIQKKVLSSGSTFNEVYNKNYAVIFNNTSYQRISEGNITFDGLEAYENTYKVDAQGLQKQQRVVWLEKDGNIYVILFSALVSDFNNEKANFDLISNSFKV